MVGDRGRECDGQTAPRLAGLLPRVDLFGFDVGIGEDEGGGEVVPHGVAREVGDLDGVPGRAAGVELGGERATRITALVEDVPAGIGDDDPLRVDAEAGLAPGDAKRGEGDLLAVRVEGHGRVGEDVGPPSPRPERTPSA